MRRVATLATLGVLVVAGLISVEAYGHRVRVTSTPTQSIVPYAAGTAQKANFGAAEQVAPPGSILVPVPQPRTAPVPQPGGLAPKLVDPEPAAPAGPCLAPMHGVVVPVCASK